MSIYSRLCPCLCPQLHRDHRYWDTARNSEFCLPFVPMIFCSDCTVTPHLNLLQYWILSEVFQHLQEIYPYHTLSCSTTKIAIKILLAAILAEPLWDLKTYRSLHLLSESILQKTPELFFFCSFFFWYSCLHLYHFDCNNLCSSTWNINDYRK